MHKYKIRATEYPGGKEVIFQPVGDAPQRKALYLKDPKEFSKFKNGDEVSFGENGRPVSEAKPKAEKETAKTAEAKTPEKAKE